MTVETPPALNLPRRTPAGAGLTLPIAKALAHLMIVNEACEAGWDISAATARGEVAEAASHLDSLYFGEQLITHELQGELDTWIADIQDFHRNLATEPTPEEGAMTEDNLSNIRQIISQTWALCTVIDRELTGLSALLTDPGTRP